MAAQVSVIIPAHNAAGTIGRAVRSALREEACVEVIVVDDGSTDGTGVAATSVDGRVRCLSQANAGPNTARNRAAASSVGEYLVFLDADDELLPGWGEAFSGMIAEGPDLASCGVIVRDVVARCDRHVPPTDKGPAYDHLVVSFLAGSYAVRRDVFEVVGGFAVDIPYGEHHELGLRLAPTCAGRTVSTAEALVLIHHDRSPARRQAYHQARLVAVQRKLQRHGDRLQRDPALLANHQGVCAYSAASLGDYRTARRFYVAAFRTNPSRWKDLVRATVTLVPSLRRWAWA